MNKNKWEARIARIKETYPELQDMNWSRMFSDNPDVLNSMLGNVARSGITKKNKLDRRTGTQRLAAMSATDYTDVEFSTALDTLCNLHSVADLDMGEEELADLRAGRTHPSIDQIELVARFFSRHPSYFLEYRVAYVLASVSVFLTENPEVASSWFSKAYSKRALGSV